MSALLGPSSSCAFQRGPGGGVPGMHFGSSEYVWGGVQQQGSARQEEASIGGVHLSYSVGGVIFSSRGLLVRGGQALAVWCVLRPTARVRVCLRRF